MAQLAVNDASFESLGVVKRRDECWTVRCWPNARLAFAAESLYESGALCTPDAALLDARNRCAAMRRLLLVELALMSFRETHGRIPQQLDELVPEFLPAVPQDPFGAGSLKYRLIADGKSYLLYSVGADGVDNGGKLITWRELFTASAAGDLDLDIRDRSRVADL